MFRIGQKVVCIHSGGWKNIGEGESSNGVHPKKDEVVTIKEMEVLSGQLYLILEEYYMESGIRCAWNSSMFRPLDDKFAEEVLKKIKEEIEQEELIEV